MHTIITRKSLIVSTILDRLFPVTKPFLLHTDPFSLLIAVMLSAHTTDKSVNLVTPLLFKTAPTPKILANLPLQEIENIIKPCGLFRKKAFAVKNTAKMIVENHNGIVPKSLTELITLPGVGTKTAQVVLCQAFNIPGFPIDTHIFRCSKRWNLSKGSSINMVEQDLKNIFPIPLWCKRHIQIIAYARKYCPAKSHYILQCPICSILQQQSTIN